MKRLVSLLTAVLFLFTMLPVGALADGAGTLTVRDSLGATLEANDIIDTVEGVLTLEVADANAVDLDGITISDYKGAVVATKKSPTEIEVKFGRLAEGAHTLTVGTDTFIFEAEKKYHVDTDFSDYTVGTSEADENLCYLCGWGGIDKTNTTATITAHTSGSDSYLKMDTQKDTARTCTCQTTSNTHGLAIDAGELENFNSTSVVNDDKVFVIDAVIVGGSSAGTFIIDAYDSEGNSMINPSTSLVSWNSGIAANCDNAETYTFTTSTKSSLKWREPKAVLRRADDGTLARDLYDVLNDHVYVGTSTKNVAESYTVPTIGVLTRAAHKTTVYNLRYDSVQAYSERLLSILDVEVSDDESNTVVLHMSDDVLETVSGDVAVTGATSGEVFDFTQTIDNDNRTITLTFASGLAADTYTVDISALYGSNQLKAYTGTKAFTLTETWEEAKLAAPVVTDYFGNELEENDTIRTIDGELTLTFADDVDADTVDDITIAGVVGKVVKAVTDNVVTLKFGRLDEETTYTLSVPASVQTTEGRKFKALELNFTAEKKYHVNTDFSDYTIGQNIGGAANLYYLCHWGVEDATNTGYSLVTHTSSTDKYLKLTTSKVANTCTCGTVLNTHGLALKAGELEDFNSTSVVNKDKVFVIDAVVRTGNNGPATYLIDCYTSGGTRKTNTNTSLVSWNAGKAANTNLTLTNNAEGDAASYTFTTNSKSSIPWREPKAVLRRAADGTLARDLYDVLNNHAYVGTSANNIDGSYTVPTIGILTRAGSTSTAYDLRYDSVQAYCDMLPSVLAESHVGNKAIFYMSDDIDEDSLENVAVTKAGEPVVIDTPVFNAGDRSITITLPAGSDEYTIDMSAVQSTSGLRMYSADATKTHAACTVTGVVFKDDSGYEITDADDLAAANVVSVEASIVNAGEDTVAYLVVYDTVNNKLIDVVEATITDGVVSATTKEFAPGVVTQAKLFVWESISTLTPLVTASQCLQL